MLELGGIHALARIAHDFAADHRPVIDIAAYLRARRRAPDAESQQTKEAAILPHPDVEAIASVLRQRNVQHEQTGANMRIQLAGVDLRKALLAGVTLTNANLAEADLNGAFLDRANLDEANLTGARLRDARLTGVSLRNAKLRGTDATGASVNDGADLTGAVLLDADLREANLEGAIYSDNMRDATTRFGPTQMV